MKQPIQEIEWIEPVLLKPNDYNPNRVFGPEFALLKTSLLQDGWTQPIVATEDGFIVDGFHRWTLASTDPEVAKMTNGLVPVVRIRGASIEHRMESTVRHNRARGKHGVLKMGDIVRALLNTRSVEEVRAMLGMDEEEIDRLAETKHAPDLIGKDSFGKGWIPDPETPGMARAFKAHAKANLRRKKK